MFRQNTHLRHTVQLLALLAIILAILVSAGPTPPVAAAPLAGTISGTVFRDFDNDGTRDTYEPGIANITVTATDNLGNTATTTTAGDGTYTTTSLAGSRARVEFSLPTNGSLNFLQPSVAGATTVQFIDISAGNVTNINTGFFNPSDYYGATPRLATTIFRRGDNTDQTDSTLDDYLYTAAGTFGSVLVNNAALAQTTGTTYGLAYQRQTGRLYTGAYVRRGASLSPISDSTGSIFRIIDRDASQAALLVNLNGLNGINTGTNPHPIGATNWTVDGTSYGAVGKRGLGDVEISEDGRTLYAVNLFQRSVVVIPFKADLITPDTTAITQVTVPDQANCPSSDFERPFALKYQDGTLYVGAVCTAEGSGSTGNLRAYVFAFNPTTTSFNATPILDFPLNYPRRHINDNFGSTWNNTADGEWRPWSDTWRPSGCYGCASGTLWGYPQPMFTDIEFDNQGFMMLGFRDRLADQAYAADDPGPNNGTLYSTRHGGDTLLACQVSGTWTLENAGTCNGRTTADPNSDNNTESNYGSGPGNREFYYSEHYDLDFNPDYHRELSVGSLALLPGSNELVATIFDTFVTFESGTVVWSNSGGDRLRAVQLYPEGAEFGKAGGIGDTELLGSQPFIEIGNRVWVDSDNDGVQDPGEAPLANVNVGLYDAGGTLLATATTDANGNYYFSNAQTTGSISVRVNAGEDDAEQRTDTGATTITSNDLEPVNDNNDSGQPYAVGVRFTNLAIPAGATITNAYIQFTTDDSPANSAGNATFTLQGHDVDSAAAFAATANNITSRATTTASVIWSGIPAWSTAGQAGADQRTPDLSSIVQEIVDRPGWTSGNAMAFIVTGASTNHREAESYNGTAAAAPLLVVEYSLAGSGTYVNLQYDTPYELRVALNQAPISGYSAAPPDNDASSNGDLRDTDGQPAAGYVSASLVTGGPGANNHTYDFGFVPRVSLGDQVWNDEDNDGQYDQPVRVGDFVWYDLNADGLQSAGEPGVEGVRVALHRATDANCAAAPLAITTTAPDGSYLFDNLPPGNYFVCFNLATLPAGFTPTTQDAGADDIDSDANPTTGQTAATGPLSAGTQYLTLDMGIVRSASVAVGDRVWYDTDRDGIQDATEQTGVPGVRVQLYTNGQTCGTDTPLATTYTNNQGTYLFAGLPPGDYFVCFDLGSLPAGYEVTLQNQGANDGIDSDANPTTGATASTGAIPAGGANMTLDMGIRASNATTNSLGDRVWYDQNRDGDQDNGAEPGASGVRVTLHPAGASCADIPLAITTTDSNGYYLFTGLPDGSYFVCFDLTTLPAGYSVTTPDQGGNDTQDSDANPTTGQTPAVALAGGSSNTTLDMGLIRTDAGTVAVGDYVWLDADRDGLQDVGEPGVPGIQVALYQSGQTCGTSPQTAVTITDASGKYLFNNLPPGNYFVCFNIATIPTGFEATTANVGGDDTIDSDANATTGVTANTGAIPAGGANMTLDMGIRSTAASTVSVGDYVWYDNNGNGTQDSGEGGVPGVRVTLYSATTNQPLASTTTNPTGGYLFSGLPSASYYVIFDLTTLPAGFAVTLQDVGSDTTDSDANPTTGQTAATGTIPAGGSNLTLDMGLRPAGTVGLGDRVWYDLDANGRQDAGEPGTPGVTVYLYRAGQSCQDRALGSTITDPSGHYSFNNLAPGNYFVCFNLATLPAGYTPTTANNQADDSVDSDANITSGQTAPTGNLTAGQYDPTLDMGIVSSGNVSVGDYVWYDGNRNGQQDAGESGVTGVRVALYRAGQTCDRDFPLAITTTAADGSYRFSGLPTGSYFVCFDLATLPAGYEVTLQNIGADTSDSDADPTTGATAATPSLTIGQSDLTLDMGIRQANTGTVAVGDYVWYDDNRSGTQDPGETGVPGVGVDLHTAGQTCADTPVSSTTTGSDGAYLFSGLPAGDYFVCFNLATLPAGYIVTLPDAGGNDGTDSDANPATGQTPPTGPLANGEVNRSLDMGIYAPDHELPLSGVTIQVYAAAQACDGTSYLFQITTDANGNYVFPDLPAGDYYVHVPASNFASGQPLEYMFTSTGNDPAPDPDSDPSNTDDNGTAVTTGACAGGVSSAPVTLTVAGEPTGDGGTDPNTPDPSSNLTVDLGFFEPLCLGDLVWFDADNSGTVNGSEYGLNGINLNIYRDDGDGLFEPGGDDGAAIGSTTTSQVGGVDGSYSFCTLGKGDYFVHIPATEFQPGDLLYLFGSSTANINPETTVAEDDDNGTDGGNAAANGIVSVSPISLALRTEPTFDNDTNDNGRRDSSTNQTVDFGVYPTVPMDYGDLPGSYNNTILGDNGPRHTSNGLTLGPTWDADNDGQEDANAAGDDNNGDDEDGVIPNGNWSDGTGNFDVTISGDGCLNVWLDFTNGTLLTADGDFNDTYSVGGTFPEHVVQNQVVGAATTSISFNLPLGVADSASLFMRVRLTPRDGDNGCASAQAYAGGGGASPTGLATGGEVEDYLLQFNPTAISLKQVAARPEANLLASLAAGLLLIATAVLVVWRRRQTA